MNKIFVLEIKSIYQKIYIKIKQIHFKIIINSQYMFQESSEEFQNFLPNESSGLYMRAETENHPEIRSQQNKTKKYFRIIKKVDDVKLKLKKGKNTPTIHVYSLRDYMDDFKHHYTLQKRNEKNEIEKIPYFEDAKAKVYSVAGHPDNKKRQTINTTHLEFLFGGKSPSGDDPEAIKQFIINRMNAKVLELIYQKHLLDIVFDSAKIEDKLTTMMYIQQYRTRLPNPLLCGKLECFRPMISKDKKLRSKSSTDNENSEKKQIKQKPIRK